MADKKESLQDSFLNGVRKDKNPVTVFLVNGVKLQGIITWFDNFSLGVVLALAMILNIVIAGLSGILIPIGLNKLGIDPAIASTVFLTTITDVVGFFSFLGLAALFLV